MILEDYKKFEEDAVIVYRTSVQFLDYTLNYLINT